MELSPLLGIFVSPMSVYGLRFFAEHSLWKYFMTPLEQME